MTLGMSGGGNRDPLRFRLTAEWRRPCRHRARLEVLAPCATSRMVSPIELAASNPDTLIGEATASITGVFNDRLFLG